MTIKGSKYVRKHTVELPSENPHSVLPDEDCSYLDVIYDDVTFLETFAQLKADEQLKVFMILKKLSEHSTQRKTRAEKELIEESAYKIDKIIAWAGLKKEEIQHYPLSFDEHHVVRVDFYGAVDKRPAHQLSSYYMRLKNKRVSQVLPPDAYKMDDLLTAPAWQIFRQFRNFRNIEDKIRNYLSVNKYSPQILGVMGVKDFSDLIFNTFKKSDKDLKASFVEKDNERNAFVKALAYSEGDKIKEILLLQDWDERCVDSLLNAMKKTGQTTHVIVTEKYFTEQVLNDFKKKKIPTDEYKVGDPIPEKLCDYLFEHDLEQLIVARDETGKPLQCPTTFQVHHKEAINNGGKLPCIASVEYRDNFLLSESGIHSGILHSFDKLSKSGDKESYLCRIEFEDKNTVFMSGLDKKFQFSKTWEEENYNQRLEEDKKYVVSYVAVMGVLEYNRNNYDTPGKKFQVDKVTEMVWKKYLASKKSKGKR